MKKILLTLIAVSAISQLFAQYYCIPFKNEGKNPNDLNKDVENPYPSTPAGWTVLWNGDENSTPTYTTNQTIPFAFKFNGTDVTRYKVSNAGFVTFSTTSSTNLTAFSNLTLPNANVPDSSICILGLKPKSRVETTTLKSAIMTKTFGTAPNRQHWVQFNIFGDPNIQAGWSFWSVVFEESTNNIYIVDMRTLCVTSAGAICGNNVRLSAGIQINSTTAVSVPGSPNLGAGNIVTNVSAVTDNSYYLFKNAIQPANDLAGIKVGVPDYLALTNAPFTVSGTFMNQGSDAVTKFDFAYRVNNGTPVVANVNSSIAVNARATVTHPTLWTPTLEGTYKVAIWPAGVNGSSDGLAANDTVFKNVIVVPSMVERKSLQEIFTSSTCPPCKPGNENTDLNIFPNREGKFTVIKYQQDFPGTGDPYATSESVNRRSTFYAINSIPRMEVDGGWDGNAGSYSLSIFDQYQSEPAFMKIEAKHDLQFGNTIKVDVKITPLIDFNNPNLKMYVAINEKYTDKNIKTNGEVNFNHVMKKMLPNENGTAIGALTKNVDKNMARLSYQFKGSYRLPLDGQTANRINLVTENSVEEMTDLEVVVFIQDAVTKKVYQSEYSVGTIASIDNAEGLKNSFVIFPNPTNGNANLKFTLDNSKNLNISLYNSMGQMVKVIDNRMFDNGVNKVELNTDGLAKGLYFVKINGDNLTTTKSFIIN